MTDILIVYCTMPPGDQAADISRALVRERLAACVNLLPKVRSLYEWQGEICDDAEQLALIKTTAARLPALQARLVALHPYETPEILAVRADASSDAYAAWVRDTVAQPPSAP
jgi:periplasmic divalent cation tolerance protein